VSAHVVRAYTVHAASLHAALFYVYTAREYIVYRASTAWEPIAAAQLVGKQHARQHLGEHGAVVTLLHLSRVGRARLSPTTALAEGGLSAAELAHHRRVHWTERPASHHGASVLQDEVVEEQHVEDLQHTRCSTVRVH
jgi:hypothetical protein